MGEAFQAMYTLESACQAQIAAQAGGADLIEVQQSVLDTVAHAVTVQRGVLSSAEIFAALLRKLDRRNPGYDQ
jgi:ribulose-5-phosphate 4-epimerase/fuculose-1-phosphate aldolase